MKIGKNIEIDRAELVIIIIGIISVISIICRGTL